MTRGVGLDSSSRKSNLIFPLIDSGTVVHGVNIPRMENGGFSYLNSTPGEPRPLQGQEGGRECEKAKAELSPRAEEVVGGLATELFKSRPDFPRPPLLDSFATVETKEISFRRPARGMFEGWRGA